MNEVMFFNIKKYIYSESLFNTLHHDYFITKILKIHCLKQTEISQN